MDKYDYYDIGLGVMSLIGILILISSMSPF